MEGFMNISGGAYIAKMLQKEGVEKVFGIIDGTYIGLFASFKEHGIEFITPRHETNAAHMAGAYARLTGKLGVCMASNGPGVANVLPGVAVENAEGNRVLLLTSSRRPQICYPDRGGSYQCFDQVGVISAMSKYSVAVKSPDRIAETMRQAFRKSYQGRPGLVHVDVPENIMNGKTQFADGSVLEPSQYRRTEPIYPSPNQIKEAAKLLVNARFPVIHAGSGIIHSGAYEELEAVANILHAPVTTSWGARGAVTEDNALSIPMVHIDANDEIRKESDLILTLGSRLGETDWWGKMPNWGGAAQQQMIQVDIDEDYLGRNKATTMAVMADVRVFLHELLKELKTLESQISLAPRKEIVSKFLTITNKDRCKLDEKLKDMAIPMNTSHISGACRRVLGDDAIAVFDGGNTCVWGQFFYKAVKPGNGISTPKMGMLGAGQAQTLAACVAFPEKNVYCIIGDGAMGFHPQEIETAVRNNLKPIFLVVADRQWGMVKMTQQFAFRPIKTMIKKSLDEGETINGDLGEIAWDKLGESMGAHGERISDPKDIEAAIKRCKDSGKASVIHLDVDPVKHMWAPGLMGFKKMHQEPKGK